MFSEKKNVLSNHEFRKLIKANKFSGEPATAAANDLGGKEGGILGCFLTFVI